MREARLAVCLFLGLYLLRVSTALGAPDSQVTCAQHFQGMTEAYASGKHDEALRLLDAVPGGCWSPLYDCHRGQILLALKRLPEACAAYDRCRAAKETTDEEMDQTREARDMACIPPVTGPPRPPLLKPVLPDPKPPQRRELPVRRRAWFWSVLGSGLIAGVVTGVVLGTQIQQTTICSQPGPPCPNLR